jgi:hypothetical protein
METQTLTVSIASMYAPLSSSAATTISEFPFSLASISAVSPS